MRSGIGGPLFGAALAALAGCGPPPEARDAATRPVEDLPRPSLAPTARFDAPLAAATPDAATLQETSADLAARAAALQARAAALQAPVIAPDDRPAPTPGP